LAQAIVAQGSSCLERSAATGPALRGAQTAVAMGCTVSQPELGSPRSQKSPSLTPRAAQGQQLLSVRVCSAELNRTFDIFGKMDPFAVVQVVEADGSAWEMARTATHWGGHMAPSWDHTCRGVLYHGKEAGGRLRFQVHEKNFREIGKATFCGEATVATAELAAEAEREPGQWAPPAVLALRKGEDTTGTIVVQVGLGVEADPAGRGGIRCTLADARRFEAPVRAAGREECQGGAPCFSLRLRAPGAGELPDRWVGKDANAGAAEVPFYERCRELSEGPSCEVQPLLEFMLEYAGVVECPLEGKRSGGQPKQMMVLQNLASGTEAFRSLDIKLGEQAVGGVREKESRFGMIRQGIAEGLKLEAQEGFFLENFVGQPGTLRSRNPLIHTLCQNNASMRDKAIRVMLQRMPAAEMFMHFVDVHLKPTSSRSSASSATAPVSRTSTGSTVDTAGSTISLTPALPMDSAAMATTLSPTEMAELALGEVALRLTKLGVVVHRAAAPQNWLRSSVALCFDSAPLPRSHMKNGRVDDKTLHQIAKVKLHNWGNSQLVTKDEHMSLNPQRRKERIDNWRCYKGGVDRLAWEALQAYRHRFCNPGQWKEMRVTVLDFDSTTADDVIGSASLPLVAVEEKTVPLTDSKGSAITTKAGPATITYAMQYRDFPAGARLRGAWCVTILRASNLTVCDKLLGTSDPYATVCALSEDGVLSLQQNTAVVARNLNPTWNECLEFPLAREGTDPLRQLLGSVSPGLAADGLLGKVFPPRDAGEADVRRALVLWGEQLTRAATTAPPSSPLALGGA